MKVTFVTGNPAKAKYFSELMGHEIAHHGVETHEIQSVDLVEVAVHKAKEAYEQLKTPVIVEDTSLIIHSLGHLPGPFIKWFIEEVGLEGICRLADISPDRGATAAAVFCYYGGSEVKTFKGQYKGVIPDHPRGDSGFGWNPIFVPYGDSQTMGEMDDASFKKYYTQIKPFGQLREFLEIIDKE